MTTMPNRSPVRQWIWFAALSFPTLGTVSANAQGFERDYSKYLRPIIFVLPAAPKAGGKFTAKLDILVDGTVQLPVSVGREFESRRPDQ
jgi:hypothetical protein